MKLRIQQSRWIPTDQLKGSHVKTQTAGVIKVAGQMLGLEFLSLIEKRLTWMSGNEEEWQQLRLSTSKSLLKNMMSPRVIGFLAAQYTMNFMVAGIIPWQASIIMNQTPS